MRIPAHPTLIRRMLDSRLKKVAATRPVLAASFVQFQSRCGKPSCSCAQGGPKHTSQHLTFKDPGQKTRSVYVPKDLSKDVQSWIAEHRRLKKLLQEIHQLTVALVHSHARQQKHKKGRA